MLSNWKRYIGEIITLVCAVVIISLAQPWLMLDLQAMRRLEIANEPFTDYLAIVHYAGWAALGLAVWSITLPKDRRLTALLSLAVGLIGLVYYPVFFYQNGQTGIDMMQFVRPSFWAVLVACVGLVLQIVIPHAAPEASTADGPPGYVRLRRQGFWTVLSNASLGARLFTFGLFIVFVALFSPCLTFTVPFFLVTYGLYWFVRGRRRGQKLWGLTEPVLFVNADRLHPGDTLEVIYRQRATRALELDALRYSLALREMATYGSGSDAQTENYTHNIKNGSRKIGSVAKGDEIEVELSIAVPSSAMHTFAASHNKLQWLLMMELSSSGEPKSTAKYTYELIILPEVKGRWAKM